MNIRITEQNYRLLKRTLRSSFSGEPGADETGCLLLVGVNNHPDRPSLLVREIMIPGESDLRYSGPGHLVYAPNYLRRAMLRARALGLAGFVTVHTHPRSNETVNFSPYDNREDPSLMGNLYDQQPSGIFGSMVVGRASFQARVWESRTGEWTPLEELVVIGEGLTFVPLNGRTSSAPAVATEIFDRSLALTGSGALSKLSKMRAVYVGASGTGALAIEAGQRCGFGEIVIIEFDHSDVTNLGRVLHLRRRDANEGRLKRERMKEVIEETGLGTRVTLIEGGDVTRADVAAELAGGDVILGCVDDSHWARLIMSEASHQYLIPYIDMGTEIGLNDEQVQSLDTRVTYCAPGRPCLVCSGIVDLDQVRLEGLSNEERDRVMAMGYSRSKRIGAPAVMDLNMLSVGYGMLVLRHLLQPFLDTPIPTHIKGAVTNYSIRKVIVPARPDCPVCSVNARMALGDGRALTTRTRVDGFAA